MDGAFCPQCQRYRLQLDAVVPLGRYEDRLRDLVLEMKRPDGQGLAAAIGQWFVVRRGEELGLLRPQLVAPIPHHWQRWLRQPASSPHTLA
ncbi:MAG: hypothetical protein ACOY3P_00500, partial [Planctomycetota bacterium]